MNKKYYLGFDTIPAVFNSNILAHSLGCNLNHKDRDGRTALCVAALCQPSSARHVAAVACLLNHGADVRLQDNEGISPLLGSSHVGLHEMCELCLDADALIDQPDK
ncbi:unnamed protein product [Protopolystoma xenopodis]|uniref:Uncharacterized protein n=1 Tax=Protopolystoma xenopodis TaxID=117903 RepID=A0A448WWW3_9PLAT|nr:unnamed protein product [Protopolystoma xenopodis]